MEVKCLEIRDAGTFIPDICIRPVPVNEEQRYLIRRDGYRGNDSERCIIVIKAQCRGVSYDPYNWDDLTMKWAHHFIELNWSRLKDGDVIDVEYLRGITTTSKESERVTAPID